MFNSLQSWLRNIRISLKTIEGKLAAKVYWVGIFLRLATNLHIKNSLKIDGMVTVCHYCASKHDKFSKQLESLTEVIQKAEKYSFDVKRVLNQHHTPKPELGSSWRLMSGGKQPVSEKSRETTFQVLLSASFERDFFCSSLCVGLAWRRTASSQKQVIFFHYTKVPAVVCNWFDQSIT